jgi:hypothetical protein
VIGILLAKDLLRYYAEESFDVRDMLRPAIFIPESKRLNVLLRDFRANHNHMAIVVDEYSGVAGLITIEDVLEQIVGDIEDEYDFDEEEDNILSIKEGQHGPRWRIKALTEIEQFNEELDTALPDDDVDTIGGLVAKPPGPHAAQGRHLRHGRAALRSIARGRPPDPRAAGGKTAAGARRKRRRIMRFRRANPNDPPKPQRSTRGRMLITGLAGALCVFAFAPFGWWPLEILGLATLFYQVLRSADVKSRRTDRLGLRLRLDRRRHPLALRFPAPYGAMAAPLAVAAVLLLAAAMAIYVALAMGGAAWLRKRWTLPLPAANLLVLPAMWALFEWIRGWLFTGFPWLSAGYAHNHSPLAGYAPIIGMYGLGWLAAVIAGALLLLLQTRLPAGVLIVAISAAGVGLSFLQWTYPEGKPISVRLLQGNIPQDEKFNGAHVVATMKLYQDAIMAAPADLIATPETAVVTLPQLLPPDYLSGIAQFLNKTNSNLILGIPMADSETASTSTA